MEKREVRIGDWFTVAGKPDAIWIALRFEPRYAQAEEGAAEPGALIGRWVIAGGMYPDRRTYDSFDPADCVPAPPEAAAAAEARVAEQNAKYREALKRYSWLKERPPFPDRNKQYTSMHPLFLPLAEMDGVELVTLEAHLRIFSGSCDQFTLADFRQYLADNDLTAYFPEASESGFAAALFTERWKYDDERRTLWHFARVVLLEPDGSFTYFADV